MINSLKKFILVTGHYGCGKTNFSINLAMDYASKGHKVTIVDMDLVNPYFRTSDFRNLLEEKGIRVIAPVYAASNLDIPSLPAEMYSIFDTDGIVIVDVGGDDVGATVLGRFYPKMKDMDYDMLYVVNRYRSMTVEPEEAVEILHEIEAVCRLKATKIINNSHLMSETTEDLLLAGVEFAKKVSDLTGLPLCGTTVGKNLMSAPDINNKIENIYPVNIYVTTVWSE